MPVPGLLPDVSLTIGGHMVRARALSGTLLVLIPPACQCAAMLKWLTGISAQAGAPTYLVGTPKTIREVRHLYNRLPATLAARAEVAYDANSVLQDRYGAAAHGLTAILVRPNQHVDTDHLTVPGGGASLIQALTD